MTSPRDERMVDMIDMVRYGEVHYYSADCKGMSVSVLSFFPFYDCSAPSVVSMYCNSTPVPCTFRKVSHKAVGGGEHAHCYQTIHSPHA